MNKNQSIYIIESKTGYRFFKTPFHIKYNVSLCTVYSFVIQYVD